MNDQLTIAKAWALTAGTPLYTALGGGTANRCSKWIWPTDYKGTSGDAALVIHMESMIREADANVQTGVLVTKSYGGTTDPEDALALDRLAQDRFHNARGDTASSGGIQHSLLLTGQILSREPNGLPVVISRFEFITT